MNSLILLTLESLYKKYLVETNNKIKRVSAEEPGSFALECLVNLVDDVELFDLRSINRLLSKLSTILTKMLRSSTNVEFMSGLIGEFRIIKTYIHLFTTLVTKWCVYLVESHLNSSKLLLVLVEMFAELKKTGLSQPPEFDEQQEDDGGRSKSDKFDTSEAAGLGEGEGAKDVSDQIENEEQLGDAKTQEERDREEEKNEQKDEESIKDEEKGIEMSEDFDAKMDDVEKRDEEDDEEEEGDDEQDIDDQKGSVEDPMDALDKQLWDENGN